MFRQAATRCRQYPYITERHISCHMNISDPYKYHTCKSSSREKLAGVRSHATEQTSFHLLPQHSIPHPVQPRCHLRTSVYTAAFLTLYGRDEAGVFPHKAYLFKLMPTIITYECNISSQHNITVIYKL